MNLAGIIFYACCSATAPGIQERVVPAEDQFFYIFNSNDAYVSGDNNRTYATRIAYSGYFDVQLDYSCLTSTQDVKRIDEITFGIGKTFYFLETNWKPLIGMRFRGDYGGGNFQNWSHDVMLDIGVDVKILHLEYEEANDIPFISISTERTYEFNPFYWYSTIGGLTTFDGECQLSSNSLFGIRHNCYNLYIGVQYEGRYGYYSDSLTGSQVANVEEGFYVLSGIRFGNLFYNININCKNKLGSGTLGLLF